MSLSEGLHRLRQITGDFVVRLEAWRAGLLKEVESKPVILLILMVTSGAITYAIPTWDGLLIGALVLILAGAVPLRLFATSRWRGVSAPRRVLFMFSVVVLAIVVFADSYFVVARYVSRHPTEHFRIPADAYVGHSQHRRWARAYLDAVIEQARVADSSSVAGTSSVGASAIDSLVRSELRQALVERVGTRNLHIDIEMSFDQFLALQHPSAFRARGAIREVASSWEQLFYDAKQESISILDFGDPILSPAISQLQLAWISEEFELSHRESKSGSDSIRSGNLQDLQGIDATRLRRIGGEVLHELLLDGSSIQDDRNMYLGCLMLATMLYMTSGFNDMIPNSNLTCTLLLVQFLTYVFLFLWLIPRLLRHETTS